MNLKGWALASSLSLVFAVSTAPAISFAAPNKGPATPSARDDSGAAGSFQLAQRSERGGRRRGGQAQAGAVDTTRGMADAPGLIASASLTCTPTEAGYLGEGKTAEGVASLYYELACAEGPGYFLIANADKSYREGYDCFALKQAAEQAGGEGQQCKLPANADPLANFKKFAAAKVPNCTIDQARPIGTVSATKQISYEVGCANGPGFLLRTTGPGTPAGTADILAPCVDTTAEGAVRCEYTTKEEYLVPVRALVAGSGKACTVADGRAVGALTGGELVYEVKCSENTGYMLTAKADGTFSRALDCADAQSFAGGCTLTDAVAARNEEAATYTGLAKKAGYDCDVETYRLLGMQEGRSEVVELKCKGKSEGAVAFFPTRPEGQTTFYDCTRIGLVAAALKCSLTTAEVINARLTQDVTRLGKSCQVDGFRGAGTNQSAKTDLVEVSCATGPGFMVEYPQVTGAPRIVPASGVFTCAEARTLQGGCKLPGATG